MGAVCAPCRRGGIAGNADSTVAPEVPVDPDHVPGGCRVHNAMVTGWQVNRITGIR